MMEMAATIAAPSRTMPANLDAERAILSAVLRDNAVLAQIGDQIRVEDFYLESHRIVFAALLELSGDGHPMDAVTLAEALHKRAALDRAGGPAYIGDLLDYMGTTAGVRHYVEIVREKSLARKMIRAATEIATEGYSDTLDVPTYVDLSQQRIFEVLGERATSGGTPIGEVLANAIAMLERASQKGGAVLGLTTGFRDLDDLLLGLHPSDLVILAARPAMGKTAFVMNMAVNAATMGDAAVAVFSLEMSKEQLALRMLSSESKVNLKSLRAGQIRDQEWERLTRASTRLGQTRITLDDTGALSLMDLRARARRLALEKNLDLIVIDYLQLMRSGRNLASREQEISEISRGLKALAKELNVPVVALSQLNRSLEQRGDKRPMMSDLRESGAIEQDADVIMFIYRDVVYNADTPDKNVAEVIVSKQRNGSTGTVKLHFNGPVTRFDSLSSREG